MDPRHDPNLILGHLEGDLLPEDAAKVQALSEADPEFAALLSGMANDRDLLRAAPAAEPPVNLTDAALDDLERSMLLDNAADSLAMPSPGRRRFAIAPLLTYGTIAAVLALTATAVLKSLQPHAPSLPIASAPATQGLDIADATIQAQRELARLDRADVGFGTDDAPAPHDLADASPQPDAFIVAGIAETADAPAALAALAAPAAGPMSSMRQRVADAAPAQGLAAKASPGAEVLADLGRVENTLHQPGATFARANTRSAFEAETNGATAFVSVSAAERLDDAVQLESETRPIRGALAANDGATLDLAAAAEPQAVAAQPAWTRTIQRVGDDWTRWTTLDLPLFEAGAAPQP